MAIDSVLFAADIPAGTYAVGDVVPLVNVDGPANVRSGRGAAKLKKIVTAQLAGQAPYFRVHVKNSDWIDEVQSFSAPISTNGGTTVFDSESGAIQGGHDCNLTANSGWQVYAECVAGGTSTTPNSVFALIDIDYPEVGGVTTPAKAVGFPTSIPLDIIQNYTTNAYGTMTSAMWKTMSVDYFKAGYKYVLDRVEFTVPGASALGFIAFSNAAGMGGLTRIIPINSESQAIRYAVQYSSVLQKGPMDVKFKIFQPSASAIDILTVHDYVKQKA